MGIIHIISSVSNEASGPTYSVSSLCKHLAQGEKNVRLVALDYGGQGHQLEIQKLFQLSNNTAILKKLGHSPQMKNWLDVEGESGRIDIIHNHGLWMLPNLYASWTAKKHDIPMIVAPRGTLSKYALSIGSKFKLPLWHLLQKRALNNSFCFHATSEAECADIRRLGFVQPIAIIPNGVDTQPKGSKKISQEKTLLYFGRIHPQKGIAMLLMAWQRSSPHHPDWRLVIAGVDKVGHFDELTELSKKLQLERVEFSGPKFGIQKFELYRSADVYVLPSPSENFGMTVAEALSSGTPAIATKGAPWSRLVDEGCGWWVDTSVDALANTLDEAMSVSRDALTAMGDRGIQWIERDFSWEKIAADTSLLYDWILNGGKAPPFIREVK